MLETVSFNFNLHAGLESANATDGGDAGSAGRDAFSYVIKIAKRLGGARPSMRPGLIAQSRCR